MLKSLYVTRSSSRSSAKSVTRLATSSRFGAHETRIVRTNDVAKVT